MPRVVLPRHLARLNREKEALFHLPLHSGPLHRSKHAVQFVNELLRVAAFLRPLLSRQGELIPLSPRLQVIVLRVRYLVPRYSVQLPAPLLPPWVLCQPTSGDHGFRHLCVPRYQFHSCSNCEVHHSYFPTTTANHEYNVRLCRGAAPTGRELHKYRCDQHPTAPVQAFAYQQGGGGSNEKGTQPLFG